MQDQRIKLALAALAVSIILTLAVAFSEAGQGSALRLIGLLEGLAADHFWPAVAVYVAAFAILITVTLPLATLLAIAGGFFFGAVVGPAAALAGMTLGAVLTFALMRRLGVREGGAFLRRGRAKAVFELMDRNAIFYVVLLRIVPVAPCFAVNAGAAITRIDPARFTLASLIGLTPSAIVYAGVGSGLDTLLDARGVMSPAILLEPRIMLPMIGVAALVGISWLLRHHLPGLGPEA